ncbi:MAG: UvrD-helicase domain-containing protein [Nitrospirota bacterium]
MILHGLNESQKKAVMTTEGPVMIIAGPGTGKTLTITRRIAYLIHKGVCPENILAVTFTNRAAREMRERIGAFLRNDAGKIFIGTFHFLGLRIIQDIYSHSFVIYNRDEQASLLKKLLKNSDFRVRQLVEKISRIKNLIEEADKGVKEIYEKYQSELIKNSAFDFDDLILKPIELLDKAEVLERYRKRFRYIMADEYQDINPAQYKLVKLLTKPTCSPCGNLCVIGDSDQAIYAFRGADIANFLNFEKDFENAQRITLQKNYRSSGIILEASSHLIKRNLKRIGKEIIPIKEKGIPIAVISVPDEKAEGDVIVKEIEKRMGGTSHYQLMQTTTDRDSADGSYSFSDFAVVFRTNAQAKVLEESFVASGIPYQIIGRMRRWKRNEIVQMLKNRVKGFNRGSPFDEFLDEILKDPEFVTNLGESDLILLENLASTYRDPSPGGGLSGLVNALSLLTDADSFDPRAQAVTLTTLHMAKGLEFRVVFIAGVEEGLIPYTIKTSECDLEEERRLFYVGMTRAKDELFLTYSRSRFLYGQKLARSPSSFLREIPEKFVTEIFIPARIAKQGDSQIGLF